MSTAFTMKDMKDMKKSVGRTGPGTRQSPFFMLFMAFMVSPLGIGAWGAQATAPPQQTFRAGTTLIPVDVRVVTYDGKPVTDLRAEDFTLTEDGVRQPIAHFVTRTFRADPTDVSPVRRSLGAGVDAASLGGSNRRIFLIVLGNGRLQEPSKGLDALVDFVQTKVLPQDLIAVMAYNRATPFTTHHDAVAEVLRRYRLGEGKIETLIDEWFSGLRAQYGDPDSVPSEVDGPIDYIFAPLASQVVADPTLPNASRMGRDIGDMTDALRSKNRWPVRWRAARTAVSPSRRR